MKYSLTKSSDRAQVKLTGDIAQGIDPVLEKLAGELSQATVEIDVGGVGSINSLGIRSWRQFLENLGDRATVEFHRCPIYFIDYANMFAELTTLGTIMSFYAPLSCPACRSSQAVLLDVKNVDPDKGFGDHLCAKCRRPLEPEVPPEDYLAFLDQVN